MLKKYGLYLIRWQLSTPILAGVLYILANLSPLVATIIANLIGGLIFFWIDKIIFRKRRKAPVWELQQYGKCCDCFEYHGPLLRIVEWEQYDRTNAEPQWRCPKCAYVKYNEVENYLKRRKNNWKKFKLLGGV